MGQMVKALATRLTPSIPRSHVVKERTSPQVADFHVHTWQRSSMCEHTHAHIHGIKNVQTVVFFSFQVCGLEASNLWLTTAYNYIQWALILSQTHCKIVWCWCVSTKLTQTAVAGRWEFQASLGYSESLSQRIWINKYHLTGVEIQFQNGHPHQPGGFSSEQHKALHPPLLLLLPSTLFILFASLPFFFHLLLNAPQPLRLLLLLLLLLQGTEEVFWAFNKCIILFLYLLPRHHGRLKKSNIKHVHKKWCPPHNTDRLSATEPHALNWLQW